MKNKHWPFINGQRNCQSKVEVVPSSRTGTTSAVTNNSIFIVAPLARSRERKSQLYRRILVVEIKYKKSFNGGWILLPTWKRKRHVVFIESHRLYSTVTHVREHRPHPGLKPLVRLGLLPAFCIIATYILSFLLRSSNIFMPNTSNVIKSWGGLMEKILMVKLT